MIKSLKEIFSTFLDHTSSCWPHAGSRADARPQRIVTQSLLLSKPVHKHTIYLSVAGGDTGQNSQHPNQPLPIRRKMLKAQNFCGCVYCVYVSACVSGHQWCWHIIVRLVQTTNIFTPAPHNAAGPRHQCPALTHRARKRNIHTTFCLLAAQWPQSSRHTGQKLKM